MHQELSGNLQQDYTDFRIDLTKQQATYSMSTTHYHKSYEIYYLITGEKYYFIKDRTFHVKNGDVVLVNSYDLHQTRYVPDSNSAERILLRIDESFMISIMKSFPQVDLFSVFKKDVRVIRLNKVNQNKVEEFLFKILDSYQVYREATSKINELLLKVLLVEFLLGLNNYSKSSLADSFEHPSSIHQKISEVIVYLNNNYMEDFSLEYVSSHFFISKYYFTRVFKEITGLTFVNYLNAIRIKEAQKLLSKNNLSIAEISEKVGFNNVSHFGKVFKKFSNCSPSQYKKVKTD